MKEKSSRIKGGVVPFFQVWVDYDGIIEAEDEGIAKQDALNRIWMQLDVTEVEDELDDRSYRESE